MTTRFIGIDSGINHPAIAVIGEGSELLLVDKCKVDLKSSIQDKLRQISNYFQLLSSKIYTVNTQFICAIELPQWQDSIRGQKCIERNDFVKLCVSVGTIFSSLIHFDHIDKIDLVPPIEWKGQVPKRITRNRLVEVYGLPAISELSDDEVDALGIARYVQMKYAN